MSQASIIVTAFGAKGDGKTDSSAAFQKAIDSLTAGGEILVPAGIYVIKNVVIKSNIKLFGEGSASVLKLPANGKVWDMVLITGGNVLAENVVISDLTIDGSADKIGLKDVQMHGIDVQGGSKNLTITRVYLQNMCGDGIRTTDDGKLKIVPQYLSFDHCTFNTIGRQDIAVVHGYDVTITNCVGTGTLDIEPEKPLMKRVTASGCTFYQMQAASKNNNELAEITVKNSKFQEALLWSLRGMLVANCEITHLRISNATDVTVLNNKFRMVELFPASGTKCSAITIQNNVIENISAGASKPIAGISNQAGVGLYMWNGEDCIISNNVINAEVTGVYVSSGCNRTQIDNNWIQLVPGSLTANYGISLINQSDGVKITNNSLVNWKNGIIADGATHQTNTLIEKNTFSTGGDNCVAMKVCTNTLINQNIFKDNAGLYIYKGTVVIKGNSFQNSTKYRVTLDSCTATIGNNSSTAFGKDLIKNNKSQVTYE